MTPKSREPETGPAGAVRLPASPPLVSVVVPTHRRPPLLAKLLGSLEGQSYPRELFEVILVASPADPAFGMAAEYAARGKLHVECVEIPADPWAGRNPAAKRNHGVGRARGAWIAFIDDDCIADPGWLEGAAPFLDDPGVVAVEGAKVIPPVVPPTLTYKGLLSFTRPGGYQTCNMFYRRDLFLSVGGFDTAFPFYLEDSDLAWSVLDRGHAIPYAPQARVTHPVSEPAPWRLLDDAKRVVLLPLLRQKHPVQYRRARVRPLRWSHAAYLLLYLALLVFLTGGAWAAAGMTAGAVVLLTLAHAAWLFRGCEVKARELAVTTLLLPTVPVVRWVQYLRGLYRYGFKKRLTHTTPDPGR